MSKPIMEVIKEQFDAEQQKLLSEALESMINDRVSKQLGDLIAIKETELQKKYDEASEKYITEQIEKREKVIKASVVSEYDKMLKALEEKLKLQLENFLETVITEQISDSMLEKIAINETLQPVIVGIKKVFGENHLEINSEANNKVKKLQEQVEDLKNKVSVATKKNIQLEEKVEKTANYLLIAEKTEGLPKSYKVKTLEMFEGKRFEEVEQKIDNYVQLLKENDNIKKVSKPISKPKMDSMLSESDNIKIEKPKVKTSENSYDFVEIANQFCDERK